MGTTKLVRAGAGSGKTTRIADEVTTRIRNGMDPRRILATTFTRKAAAELKDRIQSRILKTNELEINTRVEKAQHLDLAFIGTVHSVGHMLIRRYAIEQGLSPRIEVIEDAAQRRHLRNLLAQLDPAPWAQLAATARRLCQEDAQQTVQTLLEEKRGNAISDHAFETQLAEAAERLIQIMAPTGADPTLPSFEAFYEQCRSTLNQLVALPNPGNQTKKAIQTLQRIAFSDRAQWNDWGDVAGLEANVRDGGAAIVAPLSTTAQRVARHDLLHQDIRTFLKQVTRQALDLQKKYAEYKQQRGLADFTDLEERFLALLENEAIRQDLAQTIDLVVVDEFQDTNPIQLAIFQRLADIVPESIWVGDEKQAIYGFRGTDPALVDAVLDTIPQADQDRLPNSYRSGRGLVQLVNQAFAPHFGAASKLNPTRTENGRVERWNLDSTRQDEDAQALARGVQLLHGDGTPYRDMAVLLRTGEEVNRVGESLQRAGIPALVPTAGLLSTREGRAVLAGLRLLADRRDTLAGAILQHIVGDPNEPVPTWLTDRLAELRSNVQGDPWAESPILQSLRILPADTLTPSGAVAAIIQALHLPTRVASWGHPQKRNANLDGFHRLALAYEEDSRQTGKAPTVTGLVAHLEQLEADAEDVFPVPRGLDAVTVQTFHTAKGLEWPTVILGFLAGTREPEPWAVRVTGGNAAERRPLENRRIRFWPWPFGRTMYGGRTGNQTGVHDAVMNSPEGQQLLIEDQSESKRLLYVGTTRARDVLVLAHRTPQHAWLNRIPELNTLLDPDLDPGTHPLPTIDAPYRIQTLQPAATSTPEPSTTWLDFDGTEQLFPDRFHSPSKASALLDPAIEALSLAGLHPFGAIRAEDYERLGRAVHAYLAALPSARTLDDVAHVAIAQRCLDNWTIGAAVTAKALVAAGDRLTSWIESEFPGAAWSTELPATSPRDAGGQWVGVIDLIVWPQDGSAVIIDHKSKPAQHPKVWHEKGLEHSGQLATYKQVLERNGRPVQRVAIHLPLGGGAAILR